MEGKYYVRKKSSLTSKRVKKDKAFRLTMVYADILAKGSKIASSIYHFLPKEERKHPFYRELTGRAMRLLKQGLTVAEAFEQLYLQVFPPRKSTELDDILPAFTNTSFADEVLKRIFAKQLPEKQKERSLLFATSPP
jgi:hypothetical protein